MDIKTALIFFVLGVIQGAIILDWYRDKQSLRLIVTKGKK